LIVVAELTDQITVSLVKEMGVVVDHGIDSLDECIRGDAPPSVIFSVLAWFVEQISRIKFFYPRQTLGWNPASSSEEGRMSLNADPSASLMITTGFRLPLILVDSTDIFVPHDAHLSLVNNDTANPQESIVPEGETRFSSQTTFGSLYASILRAAFGDVYSMVRTVVRTITLVVNPLPPPVIAEFFGLGSREVTLFVTLIQWLLAIGEDSTRPVRPFHRSSPDFIANPSRCTDARFHTSSRHLYPKLTTNCLRVTNGGGGGSFCAAVGREFVARHWEIFVWENGMMIPRVPGFIALKMWEFRDAVDCNPGLRLHGSKQPKTTVCGNPIKYV
jgi:hypothetical protein